MSLPTPNTRKEQYLNAIATGNPSGLPTPITREEEYLDAIAKSGGGSGDGDMKKSVYDSDLDVAGAGGIKAFVNDAISGKVDKVDGKGLSTNDYTDEDKAIVDSVTGALAEKADTEDIPDIVGNNLAKGIFGNETVLSTDTVPFVSKLMGAGKYQRKKFVGCSYVWNQKIDNGNFESSDGWYASNSTINVQNNKCEVTVTDGSAMASVYKSSPSTIEGHKYIFSIAITASKATAGKITWFSGAPTFSLPANTRTVICGIFNRPATMNPNIVISANTDFAMDSDDTFTVENFYVTDLTQLFGSTTIADYVYSLEQAEEGSGIAWLKSYGFFTEDYYTYDAGSIQSVDIKEYTVTGKNLLDVSGSSKAGSGLTVTSNGQSIIVNGTKYGANLLKIKDVDIILKPGTYSFTSILISGTEGYPLYFRLYDNNGQARISSTTNIVTFDTEVNIKSIQIYAGTDNKVYTNATYGLMLELGSTATAYEPYHKSTYPLTPTELRGVLKIDANNNIYCDGDEYASDGEVTKKYGIVDMGTLTWDKHDTDTRIFYADVSDIAPYPMSENLTCSKYLRVWRTTLNDVDKAFAKGNNSGVATRRIFVHDSAYASSDAAEFKTAMSGVYLVYEKATPTTETLTPFDYPQSVGSLEEIVDYKVEQEDRDVAIPTGHVTEYMGKGGEFTLPTLPETPSVLAYDGHNFFWKPETA